MEAITHQNTSTVHRVDDAHSTVSGQSAEKRSFSDRKTSLVLEGYRRIPGESDLKQSKKSNNNLKLRIDTHTYEDLKSAGLSINHISGNFARSYLLAEERSEVSFSYPKWIHDMAESTQYNLDSFSYSIPYHILELTLTNKELFKAHKISEGKFKPKINNLSDGMLLGFLTFSEHHRDKIWLDVNEIFIVNNAQSLGLGSYLMKCISAIGFYNNKRGVEYDNIMSLNSKEFYKAKGLTIIDSSTRHPKGCAQLKFRRSRGIRILHPLLPRPETFPPELKELSSSITKP